jgi:hypothetical protein
MEHWFNTSQTTALGSIWPLQLSAQELVDQRAHKDAIVARRGPRPVWKIEQLDEREHEIMYCLMRF